MDAGTGAELETLVERTLTSTRRGENLGTALVLGWRKPLWFWRSPRVARAASGLQDKVSPGGAHCAAPGTGILYLGKYRLGNFAMTV